MDNLLAPHALLCLSEPDAPPEAPPANLRLLADALDLPLPLQPVPVETARSALAGARRAAAYAPSPSAAARLLNGLPATLESLAFLFDQPPNFASLVSLRRPPARILANAKPLAKLPLRALARAALRSEAEPGAFWVAPPEPPQAARQTPSDNLISPQALLASCRPASLPSRIRRLFPLADELARSVATAPPKPRLPLEAWDRWLKDCHPEARDELAFLARFQREDLERDGVPSPAFEDDLPALAKRLIPSREPASLANLAWSYYQPQWMHQLVIDWAEIGRQTGLARASDQFKLSTCRIAVGGADPAISRSWPPHERLSCIRVCRQAGAFEASAILAALAAEDFPDSQPFLEERALSMGILDRWDEARLLAKFAAAPLLGACIVHRLVWQRSHSDRLPAPDLEALASMAPLDRDAWAGPIDALAALSVSAASGCGEDAAKVLRAALERFPDVSRELLAAAALRFHADGLKSALRPFAREVAAQEAATPSLVQDALLALAAAQLESWSDLRRRWQALAARSEALGVASMPVFQSLHYLSIAARLAGDRAAAAPLLKRVRPRSATFAILEAPLNDRSLPDAPRTSLDPLP